MCSLSSNWLDGTVESIEVGSVRAVVKIRLKRGGQTVTASVTKEVISLDPSPASACTPGDLRKRSIWLAPYWCAPIWDVSAGQGIAVAGTGAWHE